MGGLWQTSCPPTGSAWTLPVWAERGAPSALAATANKARRGTPYQELMTSAARKVVKGVGHVSLGGDRGSTGRPLSDAEHGTEIMRRSHDTIMKSRASAMAGAWDTDNVLGGISPEFWSHPQVVNRYPALYHQAVEAAATRKNYAATIGKNFTGTNTNTAGTPYGLVPFGLLTPSSAYLPDLHPFPQQYHALRPAGQGCFPPGPRPRRRLRLPDWRPRGHQHRPVGTRQRLAGGYFLAQQHPGLGQANAVCPQRPLIGRGLTGRDE